jgi:hypothetical protein
MVKQNSEHATGGTYPNGHSEPKSEGIESHAHSATDSDSVQVHMQESSSTQVQGVIGEVKQEGDNGAQRESGDEKNKVLCSTEGREQGKNSEGYVDRGFYVTLHGGNELPEFVVDERMFDDCMVCMNVCKHVCMWVCTSI